MSAAAALPPPARRSASGVIDAGRFTVLGGFGRGPSVTPRDVSDEVWSFDPRTGHWHQAAVPAPQATRMPSLLASDDGLIMFGGCGTDGDAPTFENALWRRRPGASWQAVDAAPSTRPPGRYAAAIAPADDGFVIFGGYRREPGQPHVFLGDLWRWSGTGGWREITTGSPAPGPRYGFGWVAAPDGLLIFGGYDGTQDLSDAWRFDVGAERWEPLPGGPPARYCPALGHTDEGLVLFGGRSKTDSRLNFDDTWVLAPGAPTWTRCESSGPGYHAKAAYASDGRGLWIHGGEGPMGHVSDLWHRTAGRWERRSPARDDDPRMW